jgi:hypothetical protein
VASEYRGESRPRRQASRHHVTLAAAKHDTRPVNDPFPPMSSKQFPAFYQRNPQKNQYRSYMRMKSPYSKPTF